MDDMIRRRIEPKTVGDGWMQLKRTLDPIVKVKYEGNHGKRRRSRAVREEKLWLIG